jgi:WD40-like Beta Propeller Repeat
VKKSFSLLLTLVVLAFCMALLNCGNDSHPAPLTQAPPQAPSFAFMQEVQGQPDTFTPMLGKFSVSGGNNTFSASPLKDPSSGKPIAADFYSITLGPDHKRGALDLWGGLDGTSMQWDIWVGNVTDASAVQISNDEYKDAMPQLSPDGTKVVYASYRPISETSYQWQIIIRNADGSGGEQVLPIPASFEYQSYPAYSPDGSKIVTEAAGVDPDIGTFYGIWIENTDGTDPVMLTNPLYSESCYYCEDWNPAFSADGSTIAFSRYDYYNFFSDIYVMDSAGHNVTKLTDGIGLNHDPMFVMVGSTEKLLFASNRDNVGTVSGFELYSMNIDGTGLTRLTNNSLYDAFCQDWYAYGDSPSRPAPRQHRPYQEHHASQAHWR